LHLDRKTSDAAVTAPPASVSARAFAAHDPCRFRPSTRAGVRVVVRLTARCNMLCEHCLAGAAGVDGGRDLPLGSWEAILGELPAIGAHKVLLTGGEPLLHRDVVELTRFVSGLGITTDLNSTLFSLTPALAGRLAEAGLTEASVSIEGPDEIHDRLHGRPGARRRLFDGVRLLRALGLPVDASLCVTPQNVDHVAASIEEAAGLGVASFTVSRMLPVGHGLRYAGPSLDDRALAVLHESLAGARAGALGIPVRCVGLLGAPGPEHCQQGRSLIGICADGTLTPCVLTRDVPAGVPRPEQVGLAAAVAEMRAGLARLRPRFCYDGARP
jgi:MoaA/NifB/PqqE/SkfB family radical SAM enzyme